MSSVAVSSPRAGTLAAATDLFLDGALSEARELAERALAADGADASALHLLGLIEARRDNLAAAISCLEKAVSLQPLQVSWWSNLALLHGASEDWLAASRMFERALTVIPDAHQLWSGQARALLECANYEGALSALQQASVRGAEPLQTGIDAAKALVLLGRFPGAIEVLQAVLEEFPDSAEAHDLIAGLYTVNGQAHLVRKHREESFRLRPGDSDTMARLSVACWDNGDLGRSLELCSTLVENGTAIPTIHSFYLTGLLHASGQTAAGIRNAHEKWAAVHLRDASPYHSWRNDRDPNRPLRIGYFGADFYGNPTYHFLFPLFRYHQRSEFAVAGYDVRGLEDHGAADYQRHSNLWRQCSGMSDREIGETIRQDEIDILVDTTGHYRGHRLGVFALHPAPLQVVFPSYPSTTGLRCFEAILTDRWVCPSGVEAQYTEAPVRLASGYLPYAPPSEAPPIFALPALRNGYLTFGVFQRPAKIGPAVWDAIAAVLRSTPESRLLIHNVFRELTVEGSYMRSMYLAELTARGIPAGRLVFREQADMTRHLEILAGADIALDTFPYNGQTTTCECLWMGVPVITVTGGYHVARVGHNLLHRAGFPQWETQSASEYVRTALELAKDLPTLAGIRAAMRGRLLGSMLLDGQRITGEIEAAYRGLWRDWCAGQRR